MQMIWIRGRAPQSVVAAVSCPTSYAPKHGKHLQIMNQVNTPFLLICSSPAAKRWNRVFFEIYTDIDPDSVLYIEGFVQRK